MENDMCKWHKSFKSQPNGTQPDLHLAEELAARELDDHVHIAVLLRVADGLLAQHMVSTPLAC